MNAQLQAVVHLICGSTGAGKSTYSKRLAARSGGIVFSIDRWMTNLFWPDRPRVLSADWSMERVRRAKLQMWETVLQVAPLGVACILDWGFPAHTDRSEYFFKARSAGLSAELHLLETDVEERWRRVQARNGEDSYTGELPFAVSREMFDFVESLWQPPSATELCDYPSFRRIQ